MMQTFVHIEKFWCVQVNIILLLLVELLYYYKQKHFMRILNCTVTKLRHENKITILKH